MCHERRPLAVKNTPRLTRTTPPECWNIIINHEILLNFYSFFNADNAIPSRIDLILKHYEGRADELVHDLSSRYGPPAMRWLRAQSALRRPMRRPTTLAPADKENSPPNVDAADAPLVKLLDKCCARAEVAPADAVAEPVEAELAEPAETAEAAELAEPAEPDAVAEPAEPAEPEPAEAPVEPAEPPAEAAPPPTPITVDAGSSPKLTPPRVDYFEGESSWSQFCALTPPTTAVERAAPPSRVTPTEDVEGYASPKVAPPRAVYAAPPPRAVAAKPKSRRAAGARGALRLALAVLALNASFVGLTVWSALARPRPAVRAPSADELDAGACVLFVHTDPPVVVCCAAPRPAPADAAAPLRLASPAAAAAAPAGRGRALVRRVATHALTHAAAAFLVPQGLVLWRARRVARALAAIRAIPKFAAYPARFAFVGRLAALAARVPVRVPVRIPVARLVF